MKRTNPDFFWKRPPRENHFFHQAGAFFKPDAAFPYDLIALRLLNLVLGAVTILFAYKAALLAFWSGRQLPIVTACLIAFLPQFTFITTTVSNDSLCIALSAIALFLLAKLRFAKDRSLRRDCVVLGVVLGLALLSKLTAMSLLPLALLAVWQVKASVGQRWRYLLWVGAGWLPVTIGWFARNAMVYGDWLGRYFIVNPSAFSTEIDSKSLFSPYFGEFFWRTAGESLVGKFGFMHIDMPTWFYRLWLAAALIGALGILAAAIRWRRESARAADPIDAGVGSVMVSAVTLAVAALIYFNLTISQSQGRLMTHVLPAFAIVLVGGWIESTSHARRLARRVWPRWDGLDRPWLAPTLSTIAGAVLIGLNLWALACVVLPAYALP